MSARASNGRFPKGSSGNRNGRPKSRAARRLETSEDLDEAIIDVLNRLVEVKTAEGSTRISLYHANVLNLATGNAQNRLAAKAFIDLARSAANRADHRRDEYERRERLRAALHGSGGYTYEVE